MKIDIAAACRDAIGIWRRDRDVIVPVAGVFFFLPNLAMGLFMDPGEAAQRAAPGDSQALLQTMQTYLAQNVHWLVLQAVAELVGVATLLFLLLAPERPTVGEALRAAFARLPVLIVAVLLVNAAKLVGIALFVLPTLYVIGRAFLVLPVLVAEPQRRFGEAMSRALALTGGQVLSLLSLSAFLFFAAQLIVLLLSATASVVSSSGTNPVVTAMLATAVAVVGAGMSIAFALVRATVYRRLSSKG